MIITGTVVKVQPSTFTDKYSNKWQWVTVQTTSGPVEGVKVSKKELTQNFLGQEVEWDMTEEQGDKGPYNRFKRPPQQGSERPASTQSRQSGDDRNRSFALSYAKDLVVAGKIEFDNLFVIADRMQTWLEGKAVGIQESSGGYPDNPPNFGGGTSTPDHTQAAYDTSQPTGDDIPF